MQSQFHKMHLPLGKPGALFGVVKILRIYGHIFLDKLGQCRGSSASSWDVGILSLSHPRRHLPRPQLYKTLLLLLLKLLNSVEA